MSLHTSPYECQEIELKGIIADDAGKAN